LAEVVGVKPEGKKHRLLLRPLERIGAKISPLKARDPRIAAIPALQGGNIATLYDIDDEDARLLLAAAREAVPLHDVSIFYPLGKSSIDEGEHSTSQAWTSGLEHWIDAQQLGRPMAILFGDARSNSGEVFQWARIETLERHGATTRIRWRDVRPIKFSANKLLKLSDGERLDANVRRGYSVIYTPPLVQEAALVVGLTPARSEGPGKSNELGEAEHDPIAYERVLRRLRRHQSLFRDKLLTAYDGRCAITGVSVPQVLEAAHIDPHSESGDNRSENGLLLRADLHALFDEGLIEIEPDTLQIHVSGIVEDPAYRSLHGQRLRDRTDGGHPLTAALRARWSGKI
jgi:hypothetical protein